MSDVTYHIRLGSHGKPKVVHSDRLCRYYGPGSYSWGSSIGVDIPNPEPAMSDEKDQDDSHEEEGGLAGIVDSTDRVTQDEVRGGVTRTPQPQWYKRVPNSF